MLPYLNRIRSLLVFLRSSEPSLESIMKYVALDTLYEFSATTLLLNIVGDEGSIHIPAGFGYKSELLDLIPERHITTDTPLNRSLRTGVITEGGDYESYLFAGPDYAKKFFPYGFAYSVAWPIPGVGSVNTFCSKKFSLTLDGEEFLFIVGEILAVEMTIVQGSLILEKEKSISRKLSEFALTSRQWTILGGIQKGRTNYEIALDLEFSESLIRQETVQIYRKLGVAGRREILESGHDYFANDSRPAIAQRIPYLVGPAGADGATGKTGAESVVAQ